MGNPLAGKFSDYFDPSTLGAEVPNFSFNYNTPLNFQSLLNPVTASNSSQLSNKDLEFEEKIKLLPKEEQDRLRARRVESDLDAAANLNTLSQTAQALGLNRTPEDFEAIAKFSERALEKRLALEKEAYKFKYPYEMLARIPGQIADAMIQPAKIQYEGARQASENIANVMRSYPNLNIAAVPYQQTGKRFFT